MTTSTHPERQWHWQDERYVPVEMTELSLHAPKTPDSATLREQNDSNPDPTYQDCWPSERYKSDGPERAVSTTASSTCRADQCSECRSAPGQPHATGCDETAKVADSVVNAVPEHVESCVSEGSREHVGPVTVESCPECGVVTDIEYVDEGPNVPFPVQSWIFEALIEIEIDHLHEIINDHHDEIVEMARKRHQSGYVEHGSKGYQWDAKTRLLNVLEELSDGGTYLTMGPTA